MNATLQLAEKYAKLKGTKVIENAHKLNPDGSITFVVVAGPKLTMTEQELKKAIIETQEAATLERAIRDLTTGAVSPTINLEDGVDSQEASTAGKALAQAKAEAKAKAKAEAKAK